MRKLIAPSFALAVFLLLLVEVVARLFFAQSMSGRFEYGYHPDAGFVEHADGRVDLVRAGGRRFYPQSFQKHRPPDTLRISVIADSVPRGPALQKSYPWLLQEELQRQGFKAEVINLSVAGYGARRSQVVLNKILQYDPSLVILHVNNSNEYEDEREVRRAQEFKGWHPRNWLMKLVIFRRLHEIKVEQIFWRLLPEKVRQGFAVSDADAEIAASLNPAKQREWQALVANVTAASAALAREHHVPLLLLTQISVLHEGGSGPSLDDQGLDDLAKSLSGGGILYLSMKDVFSPTKFAKFFIDRAHLNLPGHRHLAQALSRKVTALLPRPARAPLASKKTGVKPPLPEN